MLRLFSHLLICFLFITCTVFTVTEANAVETALSIDKVKLENQLRTDLENEIIRNLDHIIESGDVIKGQAFTQLKSLAYSKAQKNILNAINKNPELKKLIESKKESARKIYKQIIKTEPYGGYIKSAYDDYQSGQSKEIIQKLTSELTSAKNKVAEIVNKSKGISDAMDAPDADYAAILKKYGVGGKWIEKFEAQEKKLRQVSKILDSKYGDYWAMYKMIHEGMEGGRPDKKIETLFKLMEGFGSKIPVLGNFVELYGKTALAMLEATNKLKKTMAKFDEGCVGEGSHLTFSGDLQKSFMEKYPGERACPDGGIKNLYGSVGYELTQDGRFYFWTGSHWIRTESFTGGEKTLKRILTMLAKSEAKYGDQITQSDMQTAFKFYDVAFPGGFDGIYHDAKSTLEKINERAKKLATFFIHRGEGSPAKFNEFILSETNYNKEAIEAYRYKKFDLFAFRYIKGFMEGEVKAYQKHKEMLAAIEEIQLRIVWGNVKSPAKSIENLDISITATPNISVLDEIADGSKKEYYIIMNIHPGAQLSYRLQAGDIESKVIKHKPSENNKIVRVDVELGSELAITLDFPEIVYASKKERLVTSIEGGEPPYDLIFSTSEGKTYKRPGKMKGFAAKLKFNKSGPQWIEVIVTDKNKAVGEARVEVEVKDNIAISLKSPTKKPKVGDDIQIDAEITGGVAPYYLSWSLSNGKSLDVTKHSSTPSVQATYADAGKHWVKLSVKDSTENKAMTATTRLNLMVMAKEFSAKLKHLDKQVLPNQQMNFDLFITGGEPPYAISGSVSGIIRSHTGKLGIHAPGEPGKYNVNVNIKDNNGLETSIRYMVEVSPPLSIQLYGRSKVKSNEVFKVNIRITGGVPPFTISGDQNGLLQSREGEFSYQAPKQSGAYSLTLNVVDKNNHTARQQLNYSVSAPKKASVVPQRSRPRGKTKGCYPYGNSNQFKHLSYSPCVSLCRYYVKEGIDSPVLQQPTRRKMLLNQCLVR